MSTTTTWIVYSLGAFNSVQINSVIGVRVGLGNIIFNA